MYVLSEESEIQARSKNKTMRFLPGVAPVKWRTLAHLESRTLGLVVVSGNSFIIPDIEISPTDFIHVKFCPALKQTSPDGLEAIVKFTPNNSGESLTILNKNIVLNDGEKPNIEFIQLRVGEQVLGVGDIEISCGPGPNKNSKSDWLAIIEFIVCPKELLSLARARMHTNTRRDNEIKHFTKVYKLPMFTDKKLNAFSLAQQIVQNQIIENPINYRQRLHEKSKQRELHVLSLCCGAARLERSMMEGIPGTVHMTLMDINQDLINATAEAFSEFGNVDTICADANLLELSPNKYDIVICVSALHHIIELEHLIEAINTSLKDDGELWSIAEYVGRNGSMLWPDSYKEANGIFKALPDKYRMNHVKKIGEASFDEDLPNRDCSLTTFEGIRAEDIVTILDTKLVRDTVHQWSTIIWRLLGPAYVPNYDMDNDEDRGIVEDIARKDVGYLKSGALRPVGMRAIYKKRSSIEDM